MTPILERYQHRSSSGTARADTSYLLVGRNRRGQWVVREKSGRCGGLFRSQEDALCFARSEVRRDPHFVILCSGGGELFGSVEWGARKPVGKATNVSEPVL